MIGLGVFFKILGTAAFAAAIAFLLAQLAENRSDFMVKKKKVFTGTINEEMLVLMAGIIITYVLCADQPVVIPNGYSAAVNIFQPELAVVLVSLGFGLLRPHTIHAVEDALAGVWMFGALFLFTSLGSCTWKQ